MVGARKPTRLLAQPPEPKASNDHGVMKPSSTNRQLLGLSGIRGEPTASPELRLGWMQATSPLLWEREGKNFFLTSPLIGLIEAAFRTVNRLLVNYHLGTDERLTTPQEFGGATI
jgi:hypothetical protein